jgi:hypothetical protein
MRKNTQRVLDAWQQGKSAHPSAAIWTDGENIWSYDTCILATDLATGRRVMNRTKYSVTTSGHQNTIAYAVPYFLTVVGQEVGARPADLLAVLSD